MSVPHLYMNNNRSWMWPLIVTVTINTLVVAYGWGELSQRVETLEKQREEMRAEWVAARDRIEKALQDKR
jgi:outer membrane murein-binding lipoprotein Lpp